MAKQVRKLSSGATAATAYHEAGHVLAVWFLMDRPPNFATIVPDQGTDGVVCHPNPLRGIRLDIDNTGPRVAWRAQQAIVICLAGRSAQRRFAPRSVRSRHSDSDYQRAVDISLHMCKDAQARVAKPIAWPIGATFWHAMARRRARSCIRGPKQTVHALADALNDPVQRSSMMPWGWSISHVNSSCEKF
jgi:hypothetical protein